MESTYFIKSESNNTYIMNVHKRSIHLVHPILYAVMFNLPIEYQDKEKKYYQRKIQYFIKHGIISYDSIPAKEEYQITGEDIKRNIANLSQLTIEVTEKCNLKCKYCYYGEYYNMGENREYKDITFDRVNNILNFLDKRQKSIYNESLDSTLYISFYGGEPLMNMPLISKAVEHSANFNNRKLQFSMTTNGTLLRKKHIEYLVKHNVRLLISLDGNEQNNSYRTYSNGKRCYDDILKNIDYIRSLYPLYYESNINFNAVLHNKNSVSEIYDFFKKRLNKIPAITELNASGIQENMETEFYLAYRNFNESLNQSENYDKIESDLFVNVPSYNSVLVFLFQYLWFVFKSYEDLLAKQSGNEYLSTGTCQPFSKKMFITTDGKILPCEKISHCYSLGQISEDTIEINTEQIADKHNYYYSKIVRQCHKCYRQNSCSQCFYFIENLDANPICHGFMNKNDFMNYLYANINFLEQHHDDYKRMMTEVNII
ncbi:MULTISPECIES: radical SAM peptide maturase [Dysgonomonas]|uniref:radical SAM peptide maturase n=2 Tax=Dysgonomonadaceae TaxID=2005520 RepID=UPI0026EDE7CE|nr:MULTISPECIES: radical SAM peptide maturase [Dysgonomonas]